MCQQLPHAGRYDAVPVRCTSCPAAAGVALNVRQSLTPSLPPSGHCSGGALKTLCELQHVASVVMLQLCFSCASSVHLQGVMTQSHCGTQVTSYHQGSAARATESFTHHWSPVHSHSCALEGNARFAARCARCSASGFLFMCKQLPLCRVLGRRASEAHKLTSYHR